MTLRTKAGLALALACLIACGDREQAASSREAVAEPSTKPAPPEPPAPAEPAAVVIEARAPVVTTPIPGAAEPGPVYFVINTKGVARLDHEGVTLVLDKPERNLQDLFLGPDGGVYLLDAHSLRKLEGERVVEVASFGFDDVGPVDGLALAPDGTIWVTGWVTGAGGLGSLAPGASEWSVESREQLGLDFSAALAIAGDGTVWGRSANKLLRRPPGAQAWIEAELAPLRSARLLLNLRAAPGGSVFATTGQELIRLAAPALERIPLGLSEEGGGEEGGGERPAYTAELAIASDGTIALGSRRCALVRLGPELASEARRFAAGDSACVTLEAMTVDAQQRIWVASREGLSVIDRAGRVREYPAGSFGPLAGRVSRMLAVGRGPELPAAPELGRAAILGRVVVDGEGLANAKLELCPTAELRAEGSPCAGAKLRLLGQTTARGEFRFDAAPIGDYSFAVELDGQWRWITPPSFAAELLPGQDYELGTLTLEQL